MFVGYRQFVPQPPKLDDQQEAYSLAGRWLKLGLLKHRSLFTISTPQELYTANDLWERRMALIKEFPSKICAPKLVRDWNEKLVGEMHHLPGSRLFGLCRVKARPGDSVFVVPDCSFPMILRHAEQDPTCYKIIGAAWMAGGIMQGDVLGKLPETAISIV
ncbi:hypothetical protein EV356DRAFT_507976 [Viridothelium virens]|uniref:Uncharacterized protein n=1 Tax=Viridothelium virens TaxID=1048519 RepID=A0A6A6GYW6_VIRVR|nr:hypothetical protein EV356DRAFT_507976 [Viridothelium virens]